MNVAYAAKFLRTNYNDLGDWIKATGAYHSRTPKYGNAYLARIETSWNRIVSKVATARANQGLAPQATNRPQFSVADSAVVPTTKRMNRIDSTRGVKSIKVSQVDRRASEVMVVRAEARNGPIRVADASMTNNAAMPAVRQSHGVTITSPAGVDSATPSANSAGPKFVFAN